MRSDIHNLWQAFVGSVRSAPDHPAIAVGETFVTFSELLALAEKCASWLTSKGIGKGDVVGLQLTKQLATYALWLACLRVGALYVFVDTRIPLSRTLSILAGISPRLLVTICEEVANSLEPAAVVTFRNPEECDKWLSELPNEPPPHAARCTGLDPAYIMFTSGSTGEPKGAVIPHQGVLSLMRWVRSIVGNVSSERFTNINPLHFDNSVFDLFGGLLNGASLVPIETSSVVNPAAWVRRVRETKATIMFGVPTLFLTLDQLGLLKPDNLPGIRTFVFGGEGFPIATLRNFRERFEGRAKLINVYGPTETSCICSSLELHANDLLDLESKFPSLGRMHPDFDHAIFDEQGKHVAAGEVGELWIGGPNVGLGYYANPTETALRFRQNPIHQNYRSIWYRSGDLVSEDKNGMLWFHGRADNQVKVRGYRIELEEIDLAIESIEGVSRAIAVVVASPDGPEIRAAFIAAHPVPVDRVQAYCRGKLPNYMQPTRITQVDALPTNANGKVDRRATLEILMRLT